MIDADLDRRIQKITRVFCHRRPRWEMWEDDIVQELRLQVLEAGNEVARTWSINIHILSTLERWFGRCRYHRHLGGREELTALGDMAELVSVAPVGHDGRIAWFRLKEQWPLMSAHEKAGIYAILCGHACEELGVPQQTLHKAKTDALARIDSPATFAATKAAQRAANAASANARYHARKARMKAAE